MKRIKEGEIKAIAVHQPRQSFWDFVGLEPSGNKSLIRYLNVSPHCDTFYANDGYNSQVQLPSVWQREKAAEDYSTFV